MISKTVAISWDVDLEIPFYDNGTWTTKEFKNDKKSKSRDKLREYIEGLFKIPGEYEFSDIVHEFNKQAQNFSKNGFFTDEIERSSSWIDYWEDQKTKSRLGCFFFDGKNTFYLTREYYFWINFLPIYHKDTRLFEAPLIYDAQYHLALYEFLAELSYKHAALVKKRQMASSYFHMAKILNSFWFEPKSINKIGAKEWAYIEEPLGSWKFLDEYISFLNEHTGWFRPITGSPGKYKQEFKEIVGNREIKKGLGSTLIAHSFEKSPTKGVGGAVSLFFYEEAGVAPTMDKTFQFMLPAIKDGLLTTGMFIAAGSVGELKDCEPLKAMLLKPDAYDMYKVKDTLLDSTGRLSEHALFIPENWMMKPYIDEYGNSLVEEAREALLEDRKNNVGKLTGEDYQIAISQKPLTIEEAFAYRGESTFDLSLIAQQEARINNNDYPYQCFDLEYDLQVKDKVNLVPTKKRPVKVFPVPKTYPHKEGVLQVWEKPNPRLKFGSYIASIDPVAVGKTTQSISLCSIYVYRVDTVVSSMNKNIIEKEYLDPGMIVASWCGRFDDINKTHLHLEKILVAYNAMAIVENNISNFITYMISRNLIKYLIPTNQMVFIKNIVAKATASMSFGWRNVSNLFKSTMVPYSLDFMSEVINEEEQDDGDVVMTKGVERIPDEMLLQEMKVYDTGVNTDRLVSFVALTSFVKVYMANRGTFRVTEKKEETTQVDNDMYKVSKSAFKSQKNIRKFGKNGHTRSPFKNIR